MLGASRSSTKSRISSTCSVVLASSNYLPAMHSFAVSVVVKVNECPLLRWRVLVLAFSPSMRIWSSTRTARSTSDPLPRLVPTPRVPVTNHSPTKALPITWPIALIQTSVSPLLGVQPLMFPHPPSSQACILCLPLLQRPDHITGEVHD